MEIEDARWAEEDARSDDGLGGPVGTAFSAALVEAARELGFTVSHPDQVDRFLTLGQWVDQEWRGRRLTIAVSSYGSHGLSTGYRWIRIRLGTIELGAWSDPAMRSHSPLEGVELPVTPEAPGPRGLWRDDPPLSGELWAFAEALLPHRHPSERPRFVVLQARNDAVMWQLRASRLDAGSVVTAIRLLEQVAGYAERHDTALTTRLGQAPGVKAWRRFELVFLAGMLGMLVVLIAGIFILTAIL